MKIEVELITETIFSSGESDSNIVNNKALTDKDGFVYFHSKTLKGQLKDRAFWIYDCYRFSTNGEKEARRMANAIAYLFGIEEEELQSRYPVKKDQESFISYLEEGFQTKPLYCEGHLKIGNLEFNKDFRDALKSLQNGENGYKNYSEDALIKAQTNIRTNISVGENGVVENKHLGQYHTVQNGFKFESILEYIPFNDKKASSFKDELSLIVKSLKRIGASTNRGRGKVVAYLVDCEGGK